MSRPTSSRTTIGSTRTRLCSQPQRWSSGSARRPRDHSQPLGSGLAPTERGPEPAGEVCGGIYRPCFPGSSVPHARLRFGRHASGSNFWRGRQVRKSARGCLFSDSTTKNRWSQPRFCTLGGSGPNLLCLTSHPCTDGGLPSRPPAGTCSCGAAEEVTSRGPVFAANEGVWPCGDPRAPRPCTSGRSCASMCPANTSCSFWRLKQPALSSHCRALLASWWRQWPAFMLGCGHCRLSARPSPPLIDMTVHHSGHSGGRA